MHLWNNATLRTFVFFIALSIGSPLLAETPCDFKGLSVGDNMSPAEIMAALGVKQYRTNPASPSFDQMMAGAKKYGLIASSEMQDWTIGPYCTDNICRVPYGVAVGINNSVPVQVAISFHGGQITEILVSFAETFWDEMVPIFDEKYGADWTIERSDMSITDYETKKDQMVQRVFLRHRTYGTNPRTNDHCKIWATNFDMVFEHHDALGPYHSRIAIQLISKNF